MNQKTINSILIFSIFIYGFILSPLIVTILRKFYYEIGLSQQTNEFFLALFIIFSILLIFYMASCIEEIKENKSI